MRAASGSHIMSIIRTILDRLGLDRLGGPPMAYA